MGKPKLWTISKQGLDDTEDFRRFCDIKRRWNDILAIEGKDAIIDGLIVGNGQVRYFVSVWQDRTRKIGYLCLDGTVRRWDECDH